MLTGCYTTEEATDVQAVNDFILFSVAGAGSLMSGLVYTAYGWLAVIYMVSVMMFLNLIFFWVAHYLKNNSSPQEDDLKFSDVDILDSLLNGNDDGDIGRFARVRSMSVA